MIRLPQWWLGLLALALLVGLTMPVMADETKGKIKSVVPDKNEFVLVDSNNKDWTFHLDKDAKVFIDNKEGKLADVKADDMANITYKKEGEKLTASTVRCTRKK